LTLCGITPGRRHVALVYVHHKYLKEVCTTNPSILKKRTLVAHRFPLAIEH